MFNIEKIPEHTADICEQCTDENHPLYWLKGRYDNLDTMLCTKCLENLKEVLNNFSLE